MHSEIEVGECLSTKSRGVQDPYSATVTFAPAFARKGGALPRKRRRRYAMIPRSGWNNRRAEEARSQIKHVSL